MSLPDFTRQTDTFTSDCNKLLADLNSLASQDKAKSPKNNTVQSVAKIIKEKNDQLNTVRNEFRKSVKLLKAHIQFAENSDVATKIENQLEQVKSAYQELLTSMHTIQRTSKTTSKDLNKHIQEGTKALLSANRTLDLAEANVKKLKSREKIGTQQPVVHFGELIDQLREDGITQDNIDTLTKIVNKLQFRNERINSQDIENLKNVKNQLPQEKLEKYASLTAWIDSVAGQYKAAKARMKAQYENLYELYLKGEEEIKDPQKFKEFLVKIYTIDFQLSNNPIDFPIDLNNLSSQKSFDTILKKVILKVQALEDKKDPEITRLLSDRKLLADAKLEGLKIIRNSFDAQDNKDDILISGAGPGGLMFGLMQAVQNRSFTILESRTKEGSLQRENILALGKESDPTNLKMFKSVTGQHSKAADTKLLDFFGINDLLIAEKKAFAKHVSDQFFQAKICDLQDAMIQRIAELQKKDDEGEINKDSVICYGTRIESITVDQNNKSDKDNAVKNATITLNDGKTTRTITPKMLLVSEGFQSTTRQLLGIGQTKESSKTRMAFSFFGNKEISKMEFIAKVQKTGRKLLLALKMLPFLIKHGFGLYQKMRMHNDPLTALTEQFQRAMILLGTPQSDYMYLTLKPEEEKLLKDLQVAQAAAIGAFREELIAARKNLRDKLTGEFEKNYNLLMNQLNNPEQMIRNFKNEEKKKEFKEAVIAIFQNEPASNQERKAGPSPIQKNLDKVIQKLNDIEKEESQLVEDESIAQRDLFTLLYSLTKGSEVEFLPMDYEKTTLVAAQITAAEQNFVRAGATNCAIIGDAESTTDPISGSGFRTTILRAALLQSSLGDPAISLNPIAQGIFTWSSSQSSQSMREEGLSGRATYRLGTEKIDRFLRIAKECKVLDQDQIKQLKMLHAKAKLNKDDNTIEFSQKEKATLKNLIDTLRRTYRNRSDPGKHQFSESEKKNLLYVKAIKIAQGLSSEQLSDKETATIREINSEVAKTRIKDNSSPSGKNYLPEAWFMPLWLEINEIERLFTEKK